MSTHQFTRRQFMKAAAFAAVMIPFAGFRNLGLAAAAKNLPAGMTPVPDGDAVAGALGYKASIKDLDYTKYPQRKKKDAQKQFCDTCQLYTKLNGDWGKCQMITGGVVASKGWCGSYSKKA